MGYHAHCAPAHVDPKPDSRYQTAVPRADTSAIPQASARTTTPMRLEAASTHTGQLRITDISIPMDSMLALVFKFSVASLFVAGIGWLIVFASLQFLLHH